MFFVALGHGSVSWPVTFASGMHFSPESFVSQGETLLSLPSVCFSDICCTLSPGHTVQAIQRELCLLGLTSRRRQNWLIFIHKYSDVLARSSMYSMSQAWIYDAIWKGSKYKKMRWILVHECSVVLECIQRLQSSSIFSKCPGGKEGSMGWHWDMWMPILVSTWWK